jgi:hypothetical protein
MWVLLCIKDEISSQTKRLLEVEQKDSSLGFQRPMIAAANLMLLYTQHINGKMESRLVLIWDPFCSS